MERPPEIFAAPQGEAKLMEKKLRALQAENAFLKERIEHLERETGIDALTGAANRRAFDAELERTLKLVRGEITEHRAGAEPLTEVALIFFDLDHFKQVNDRFGHAAGDDVLRRTAALTRENIREADLVARLGGEEFAVLMRGTDQGGAFKAALILRQKIEQLTFEACPELRVSASFGVASSASSAEQKELYKNADAAMYEAKAQGRNRVVSFTDL